LHIWNTAGVGSIIAKYMDRLFGTKSLVVMRRAFDPFGFTTYGELWECKGKTFILKCLIITKRFDIIHIHYLDEIIPFIKFLYPKKLIVMHYHGDDIRGKWGLKRKYWSKADLVLYSTQDLLDKETPSDAVYVPNPVDIEIFNQCRIKPEPRTAFHISYNSDELAKKYAEEHGLELTIFDRTKQGIISHLKLPEILCQYEYYIDVKRNSKGELLPSLSKTALEALACGLKVINYEGKIVTALPPENHPENVVKQIFKLYLEKMRIKGLRH
jgi:hypothetical protein